MRQTAITCEKCEREERFRSHEQPKDWYTLEVKAKKPGGNYACPARVFDVCPECFTKMAVFPDIDALESRQDIPEEVVWESFLELLANSGVLFEE